jgi:YfiH family protein
MFIKPKWPVPPHVHAYSTLRKGGISEKPYDSLNLGTHVADNIEHVLANRQILRNTLRLPNEPIWINQTHGKIVLPAKDENRGKEADATIAEEANQICAVMTADCLPILLCHVQSKKVAAVHAGWRGLALKILTATVSALHERPSELYAWLGPAIGARVYQVGSEVRESFSGEDNAFVKIEQDQWLCNLYQIARNELQKNGVSAIYGGEYCTYSDKEQFFSYRRDGAKTGRMASLIWWNEDH